MMPPPLISYAMLNQNEWRTGDGVSTYRWEGEGWYGGNINRAWFKSEGNLDTNTGTLNEGEVQALGSHAITPFFNLQGGLRYDLPSAGVSRGWATFGVEGLAPMFVDLDAFVFASDNGQYSARLDGYYNLYITQRLVLQPQAELNWFSKADPRVARGAGLATLDSGLRLRYEFRRQFAPYIGITYEKKYGQSATLARRAGERSEDLRAVVGIRLWY
jgi:Uncharacterized protein involved in copper resistance